MTQRVRAAAGLTLALATGACASLGLGGGTGWREVSHVEDRFAVYVDQASPREDDIVQFRLMYVYAPGAVKSEGQEVGWQEYSAVTVNCATNQVKLGPRTRYSPEGETMLSDDDQSFVDINYGTAVDAAAKARCNKEFPEDSPVFRDEDGWMEKARSHIVEGAPEA